MKTRLIVAVLSIVVARVAWTEVRFEFEGFPDHLWREPGSTVEIVGYATLTTSHDDEAYQGWSLSMTADGGQFVDLWIDGLYVLVQTPDGPKREPISPCSFFCVNAPTRERPGEVAHSEDPSRFGATSGLSGLRYPSGPPPFVPNVAHQMVRMVVATEAPPAGETKEVTVRFEDGFGTPGVTNIYVHLGASRVPDVFGTSTTIIHGGSAPFTRGDVNADGKLDIADPIYTMNYLFRDATAPDCERAMDANDDGAADISDPVYLLTHLFDDGPPPPDPFGRCGRDPEDDHLSCYSFPPCE